MSKFIDLPKAVSMVLKAIADKPEGYRYRDNPYFIGSCLNVHRVSPGEFVPGCLVGTVVVNAGVDPAIIGTNGYESSSSSALLDAFDFEVTSAAWEYFNFAQGRQDSGSTWSRAHMIALEYVLRECETLLTDGEKEWLDVRK